MRPAERRDPAIAGDVPVRTDDAVGASDQVRANAGSTTPIGAPTRAAARGIIARYPRPRSALLPMLHLVQAEQGYITPEGVAMCAEELGLTKAEVGAVATFHTMYKRRPTGEYLVSVCTNTLCGVLGGDDVYAALSDHLGVGHDQTTVDGRITLEHAECLAACDYAPVVTVNYEFFDQQDTGSALDLVRALQRGERPAPTRGAPLCSFQQVSRQLAGFFDPVSDADAVNGPSAGIPTLAGNREALRRGHESPAFDPQEPIAPPVRATPEESARPTPASQQRAASGPADPQPADGQTAHKVSARLANTRAETGAEQAGAKAADPDRPEETREPARGTEGRAPRARRTRIRSRAGANAKMNADQADSDPTDGRS